MDVGWYLVSDSVSEMVQILTIYCLEYILNQGALHELTALEHAACFFVESAG